MFISLGDYHFPLLDERNRTLTARRSEISKFFAFHAKFSNKILKVFENQFLKLIGNKRCSKIRQNTFSKALSFYIYIFIFSSSLRSELHSIFHFQKNLLKDFYRATIVIKQYYPYFFKF